ncbi:MAG: GntR family transcriptional regulator [Microbacteriaceae bacterium]|jgi:DNA-binding transcriptional regulator YhcF (GntR family)|nr:GntR family transcriptional regulator [Microbacteriaceae bacterium]
MLSVDPKSPTPPFEQLRLQFVEQVTSGELAAGAKLPTVRRLADDLCLAPNTVARCYRELERDGFIETRGRNGSFVSPQGDAAEQQAQVAARQYADRVRQLGVPRDEALAWVRAALRE